MATQFEGLKISLESLGMTLSDTMPTMLPREQETNGAQRYSPESLHRSFVFVTENGEEDSSIVVLDNVSLETIQAQSFASFRDIQEKSLSMDCQSIISSLTHEGLEKKLTEVLQENLRQKETLQQNSTIMKQHLMALATKQQELNKLLESHRQKFTETKNLVGQLKLENNELRAQAQSKAEKIIEIEIKDESSQTENVKETASPVVPTSLSEVEFAEKLSLTENSEAPAKEISHLLDIIEPWKGRLEQARQNILAEIRIPYVESCSEEPPEVPHLRDNLVSFMSCNENLQVLVSNYVSLAFHYIPLQERLQYRCIELLLKRPQASAAAAASYVRESSEKSRGSLESQKVKKVEDDRGRLLGEELKLIESRLASLREENEARVNIEEREKLLEQQSRKLQQDSLEIAEQREALERERLRFAKGERKLIEANESRVNIEEREKLLEQKSRKLQQDSLEIAEQREALERDRLRFTEEKERKLIEANETRVKIEEKEKLLEQKCRKLQQDSLEIAEQREALERERLHFTEEKERKLIEANETRVNIEEREKLLEQRSRMLQQDSLEIAERRSALECERLRFEDEERRIIQANAALNDEIAAMREFNDLLRHQCESNEVDFTEEKRLRETLQEEKNQLIERINRIGH